VVGSLELAGVDQLAATARAAAVQLAAGDERPGNIAADDVLGYVQPPIRTGRLASTVGADVDALGFTLHAGGPQAPYGPIVHARDPFLTNALTTRQEAAADAYSEYLGQVVDTIQGE
jgi:hypothetical protein